MDAEDRAILERLCVALERIADHFAPIAGTRERKAAVLGKATYSREERGAKEVRATLRGEKPQSPGRTAPPAEG